MDGRQEMSAGSKGRTSPLIGASTHGRSTGGGDNLGWIGEEDWCASADVATEGIKVKVRAASVRSSGLFSILLPSMLMMGAFAAVWYIFLTLGFLSRDPLGRPALHGRYCV